MAITENDGKSRHGMEDEMKIKKLLASQRAIALLTLVVLFLFFTLFGKNFCTADTMVNLLESTYYIICVSFGMTFVIATGGIDLSVGTVAMCSALIGGVAYNVWKFPMWVSLLVIIATGATFGVLNGILTSYLDMPAFVATLGTMMMSQGVGYIISGVQTMRYPSISEPDGWFKRVFYKSISGMPMGILYMVLLFAAACFLFRCTKIGKYACAIGSNKEAARLSGVNVKKWGLLVYLISGICAGIAGVFYAATYTAILPGSGSGIETNAIAATVIGGTSMAGGYGSMLGTIIGVFIMGILKNGLMTIGIQQQWQVLFTGGAVLLAVLLDIYRTKRVQKGRKKG